MSTSLSTILTKAMDITIYYYVGKGRKTLTARIMRGQARLCDKSTGIKVDGHFDNETWFGKNQKANQALSKFEAGIFKKYEELSYFYKGNVPDDAIIRSLDSKRVALPESEQQQLTLSAMLRTYRKKAEEGNMFSKRTGKRLAKATMSSLVYSARLVERYLEAGGEDLDISEYNLSTIHIHGKNLIQAKYENLCSSFKNFLIGETQDDQTIHKNVYRLKTLINYFSDLHGIELGDLLKSLKWRKPKRDVVVMGAAQVEFVVRNFEKMLSDCPTARQRESLMYWYVALILDPRRGDMNLWDRDNLYTGPDGNVWIRYIPHKTKNSSGVTVDTPVPAKLLELFQNNLQKYGKLMPNIDHNLNLNLKRVARRYKIFQNEIQILKKSKYVTMRMCDFAHIHMMRGSGMTHKLENGWSETEVKEQSGHQYDSESFKRYVKISQERKKKVASDYFKLLGI